MAKTLTVTAWIREDEPTPEAMAEALRHIAGLIDQGMTSGYYPTWELVTEEDE